MNVDEEQLLDEDVDVDESDDSDLDEKVLELEVVNLESKIAENEFAYQPYVDLITVLKKLVDLDKLRFARKQMSKRFPLTTDLWTDWLQDEINLATSTREKEQIIDLFETAVKDYLSVELWLQYTAFIISFQNEKNPSDFTPIRNIFERALMAAGLHVMKGSALWDAYIDFEKAVLNSLTGNQEQYNAQLKLVGTLYKRQLSCPLYNMELIHENFKTWVEEISDKVTEAKIDVDVVNNIFKKAKEKLNKIMHFEESLTSNSENISEIWRNYLEHEKSKEGSPVRVQCLYERFITDNCLNEELWLEYVEYMDAVLHDSEIVLSICIRAVRNCPWCCKIYQMYIKCLEKYRQSQEKINGVVEDAFASGLQTAVDFRDIWMTYLEYLRRCYDSAANKEEEEKRLSDLRAAFAKAVEFVSQMNNADPDCTLLQFWARIEAIYCKNMEKSRELWNIILGNETCRSAEMWLEYIHLERAFGDSKHLRKLFPRALQGVRGDPHLVSNAWLNYERDEGTLESYENCLRKITVKMKTYREEQEKLAVLSQAQYEKIPQYSRKKSRNFDSVNQNERNNSKESNEIEKKKISGYKRKHPDINEETSPTKRNKSHEDTVEKEKTDEDFVRKLLEETKKSHGETVIHQSAKDHRTVFVSNLDFSTEEQLIREVFSSCGKITDLRLVRDYKGRSKGYCYVEFEKTKEAQAALKKDRELIGSRPMFVSKCDPDKETRGSGFKYSSNMEKNKLFIRGLPFTTTVDDLRNIFNKFGFIKDVRLVTYRNGHSKGLAYVEYEDEVSAAQAVLGTDGITLENKQISVAISNPPERKTDGLLTTKFVPSLGGGPKDSGPRGRSKTQISFLPRSVTLNKPAGAAESMAHLSLTSPQPDRGSKNLNNSDFRKLLG
ncbi:hypothetical protein RUM44_008151 [Polyplax serrata]|uniref:RRM domain-containing protein n=1 Tax=Polyplax serrata TaxID=468196 RepID=A0ABR1BBG9_POLSC